MNRPTDLIIPVNALLRISSTLLSLPPTDLTNLLPNLQREPYDPEPDSQDKQLATVQELRQIHELAIDLKLKLIRMGLHCEETKEKHKEDRIRLGSPVSQQVEETCGDTYRNPT